MRADGDVFPPYVCKRENAFNVFATSGICVFSVRVAPGCGMVRRMFF